jgi:hypothetical protein
VSSHRSQTWLLHCAAYSKQDEPEVGYCSEGTGRNYAACWQGAVLSCSQLEAAAAAVLGLPACLLWDKFHAATAVEVHLGRCCATPFDQDWPTATSRYVGVEFSAN